MSRADAQPVLLRIRHGVAAVISRMSLPSLKRTFFFFKKIQIHPSSVTKITGVVMIMSSTSRAFVVHVPYVREGRR